MSTVIGGAMLPHAPEFFTMPENEDKAVVAHVREVAADIGRRASGETRCHCCET
jgi:2,3-dihydroxyphenylpropionate 1,2-dioxygenase